MSKVRVSLGYTINVGNFESARYEFDVEDDTKPGETTGQAFDRIYAFVEGKLKEKVLEDRNELAKSKNHRKTTATSAD